MILYELRCSEGHAFEAWFKDSATYDEQATAGEIQCPSCGSMSVAKALMAPRVAKSRGKDVKSGQAPETYSNSKAAEMRRMLTELRRHVEDNSDYVGDKFVEEARKIHYGETEERNIYGEATDDQARELSEEGVKIGRIPWLPRTDS
ncbi:MAG: DUF1178 family protein [Alphaproteobacteria bacterium]|nr:DUF1178 family protein [Alphaproteobacteria bacterium]